jgi:AcrR family transcriptional regulator
MPQGAHRPRKIPRQARSLATVEVILDAAALLLVDEGYDQASTNRIAERAGVSIGSLYQYFPNRESIVAALESRTRGRISETIWRAMSAMPETSLRDILSFGLHTAVSSHARDLSLRRILLQVTPRSAAMPLQIDGVPQRQEILRRIFQVHAQELREDFDVEAASFFIPRLVGSAIDAAVVARPDAFASGELERELNTMMSYYIRGGR